MVSVRGVRWAAALGSVFLCLMFADSTGSPRRNVLFVMSDDLRPELSTYHTPGSQVHPHMHTPNIAALVAQSLQMSRAHVQYSKCGPSRASFLTSRRPHTTNVFQNYDFFRDKGGADIVSLPQYFKNNGYHVLGIGKVFHEGVEDYPLSWSEPIWHAPNRVHWGRGNTTIFVSDAEAEETPLPATELADYTIARLAELAPKAKTGEANFFLALGFYKPHLPFTCPERLLNYYPSEEVHLPSNRYAPVNMPSAGWSYSAEIRRVADMVALGYEGKMNETLPDWKALELRLAYYCTVTFVDEQLGRVLKVLQTLGLSDSTVVSFVGDHGWMLGEHAMWAKEMNFQIATRAPMILRVPGFTENAGVTDAFVEFVDVMPTIAEAAGLPPIPACPEGNSQNVSVCTEGRSLMPLLTGDAVEGWRTSVYSQVQRLNKEVMGYVVEVERFRYTEWVANGEGPDYLPVWTDVRGRELYDHYFDPDENLNVAGKPGYAQVEGELQRELRKGFP